MKRIITLTIVLAFLSAASLPLAAQSVREIRNSKIGTADFENRVGEIRAYSDGRGVLVEWEMAVERNNAGFLVYRLDGGASAVVSPDMILSTTANSSVGQKYTFFDADGTAESAYYVRNLSLDGRTSVSSTAAVEWVTDLTTLGYDRATVLSRQISESKDKGKLVQERLAMPKALGAEVASNRVAADDVTHAWVVSQPGVRIGVRREGLHRVTKAELLSAGFDVNGDSSLWQLYRQGVQNAIIVGPNADYIEFYGKGVDTLETDTAIYYLVAGPSAGKRIETRVARPYAGTVTSASYSQVFVQKQRTNYLSQVLNGEAENFFGASINTLDNTIHNFNLSGVDFSVAEASMELKFLGYSFGQHNIQMTLNGHPLPNATGQSQTPFSKQYTFPTSYLVAGVNSIVFREAGPNNETTFFDTISIGFRRKRLASQNQIRFYTDNYRLSKLEGFSSANIRVFDMTAESSPVLWSNLSVVQEGATFSVRMPADRGRSMYAIEDSGLQQAVSVTANNPDSLKLNSHSAHLVIITHKNWMAEAQNWAAYRANQGFVVKVVEISDIYDEFNFGDMNSLAIRSFLEYAENNWQMAPGYVLLLGDSSYDSRNYTGNGYNNYVPTHIVDTIFTETGSDDFLADFNGDGLAEMAVGRITARNGQTVTNALAKVAAFEAAAPTLQSRGVLFAYDCYDVNNNYNFQQYSNSIKNQLPGGVPTTMIGRCDPTTPPDTPQSLVISSINTGKLLVNYSGHGTAGSWVNPGFFTLSNVPSLTNANNQSVFTMLTCLNGYFLHATNTSLAEALVNATNGGAVAAWASTGETTPDEQNTMAIRFYQRMSAGNLQRLGDLVNDAKTAISGGSDVRLSWALIGDPMLKVRTATTGDRQTKVRK